MDLKTFINDYDLQELDILKIYNKDNKLYMLLGLSANIELIANGYRPEINLYYKHMFIFDNYSGEDINLNGIFVVSNYNDSNGLEFDILDKHIEITNSNVEVIMNYE